MEYFGLFILQSSLLILAVLLIRRIWRKKISPCLMYALWLIPMLRLLLPFAGVGVSDTGLLGKAAVIPVEMAAKLEESAADFFSGNLKGGRTVYEETALYLPEEQIVTHEIGDMENIIVEDSAEHIYTPMDEGSEGKECYVFMDDGSRGMKIIDLCFLSIWLSGSITLGIYAYCRNRRFLQWAIQEGKRMEVSEDFDRIPEIYRTDRLSSPCLAGIWKPVILMNEKAVLDVNIFHYALLHEKTHYEQKDHIWTMIRNILCIFYWWNPLVWLGAECCAEDGELACDSKVTASMSREEKKEYGNVILTLLDGGSGKTWKFCQTTALTGDKKILKRRIENIAGKEQRSRILSAAAVMLLLLAAVGGAVKPEAPEEKLTSSYETNGEYVGTLTHNDKEGLNDVDAHNNAEVWWEEIAEASTVTQNYSAELDYENMEMGYIIFHTDDAIYIYDTVSKKIIRKVTVTDTDNHRVPLDFCTIKVSEDGMWVYIVPETEEKIYSYSIAYHGIYDVPYQEIEGIYDKSRVAGEIIWAEKEEDCVYRTDDMEYFLFLPGEEQQYVMEPGGNKPVRIYDSSILGRHGVDFYADLEKQTQGNGQQLLDLYVKMLNEGDYGGICALSEGVYYDEETQDIWNTVRGSVEGSYIEEREDKICILLRMNIIEPGDSGLQKGLNEKYLYAKYGQDKYGNKRWYADGIMRDSLPGIIWWNNHIVDGNRDNNGGIGYSKEILEQKMGGALEKPCPEMKQTALEGKTPDRWSYLPAEPGSDITAVSGGTVFFSCNPDNEETRVIIVDHGNGIRTYYSGLFGEVAVKSGDLVEKGQTIASVGVSENGEENGIEFGLMVEGVYVDPFFYISEAWE